MTEILTQIALALAIFLMMFAATPLFIVSLFIATGQPNVVAFLHRIRDAIERPD